MKRVRILLGILIGLLLIGGIWAFLTISSQAKPSDVMVNNVRIAYERLEFPINPFSMGREHVMFRANEFESLVSLDAFYRPKRQLALSWTRVEDTVWEFVLRSEIEYSDGTSFSSQSVARSFDLVRQYGDASMLSLMDTIEDVEILDSLSFRIRTSVPDPFLLRTLSYIPMVRETDSGFVGTGPYLTDRYGGGRLVYERNSRYWDELPEIRQVTLQEVPNKLERFQLLTSGKLELLGAVPTTRENLKVLETHPFLVMEDLPSLEAFYLFFSQAGSYGDAENPLADKELRSALRSALNLEEIASFAEGGFAKPLSQFVVEGIGGYDPALPEIVFDPLPIRDYIDDLYVTIELTVPESLKIIGEYVQVQLQVYDVFVALRILPDAEFLDTLERGDVQSFVLGWQFQTGDAYPFFRDYIASQGDGIGTYNATGYSNTDLDELLREVEQEFDRAERVRLLQAAHQYLVDDVVGVPLVETRQIYAYKKALGFEPRLDGQILFSELSLLTP